MTERKRASGFVLMDAAFTSDAKFVRLARQADDPHDYATSVGVWWILLADCRRAKSPIVDWDDYTEYAEPIEKLKAAKLLNEGGFDPEPFERWAPAYRSVSERTAGTKGYGEIRSGTESTNTSGQVISNQVTSNGVGGPGEGDEPPPRTFMRSPRGPRADAEDVRRQEEEAWSKCTECGVIGRKHPTAGDHLFGPEKLRAVK